MNTVTIHVPHDAGLAFGGSRSHDILFGLLHMLRWIFIPWAAWSYHKKVKQLRKEFQEQNLREGKNPDGSYSKDFPATMMLGVALTELGFDLKLVDGNVVKRKRETPLCELTSEELETAVIECQNALW